nr:hypothetical protein [uncultured archaeon]
MKTRNLINAVIILSTIALFNCNSKQYTPREVGNANIDRVNYTIKIANSRSSRNGKNFSIYQEGADKNAYFGGISCASDTDGDRWINWIEGAVRYADKTTREQLVTELNKILKNIK